MNHSKRMLILGAIGIICTGIVGADFGPLVNKVCLLISGISTSLGILFAREHSMSSENAGAVIDTSRTTVDVETGTIKPGDASKP